MVNPRRSSATSGCDFSRRSLHAAENHVPAVEARFFAILHVLRLAKHEGRTDRVFYRTDAACRYFPAESVAEYSRYSDGSAPDRRTPGIYHPGHSGRYLGRELGNLRPRVRAGRTSGARGGKRRIFRFRKIRKKAVGSAKFGEPAQPDRAPERDPAGESGLTPEPLAISPGRQSESALL